MNSKIKIGWSEIDITPEKKVALLGQFAERISEYVEKPLTATAMAVSSDNAQMIIVSCDLAAVTAPLVDLVREELEGNTAGIDPDMVIMCAIHTHTGPDFGLARRIKSKTSKSMLKDLLPEGKKYVEKQNISDNPDIIRGEEMLHYLVEKLTKVIFDAWENRKPGSFTNAFGRAPVGMCRRATYSDGSAQMWGETNQAVFEAIEGGSDTGIELLYVYDENGKIKGIVPNLACPAQCVQHRMFVSPDFWGEVKVLLRNYFGEDLYMLPLCSAAGDQCPVDLVRWVEPESDVNDPNIERRYPLKRKADPSMFDLKGMKLTGRRIANEIIAVYEDGLDPAQEDVELVHNVHIMKLPLRRTTLAEVNAAKKAITDYLDKKIGDVDFNDVAKLQIYGGILAREELQNVLNVVDTEVHTIRLGSIAIATNPFELFLDYGNQIKARSHAEQTFLIQLANGIEGYLPTEKAEKGGHYSAFISSGLVGHIGGEQLVRETLDDINNNLFPLNN
ncbi:MAG: hypothetical protein IKJ68_00795 [Clostridia bacterium]|nr:hypothetical protein [Clostridia bacterium]